MGWTSKVKAVAFRRQEEQAVWEQLFFSARGLVPDRGSNRFTADFDPDATLEQAPSQEVQIKNNNNKKHQNSI